MGKTVAITGVNSYFASTLLPRLQADPEVENIIGIDVTPWRGGYNKVKFFRKDILSTSMEEMLKGVDTVYHLAFIVGEIKDKKKAKNISIEGSKNVFRACVANKVRKVVYTSSNTVYGAHKENHLYHNEESPLYRNDESYYNQNKIEVEDFVNGFFADYPEIVLTVIRAALLFGPNTKNMFAKLYEPSVTAMPVGSASHIHFIHEEDLGEALHIAFPRDLPGIYNVGADDAVSARWTFHQAGTKIIPLPMFMLKPAANLMFKFGLSPASAGWVIMASYTIFSSNRKFRETTGWAPKYTSEQTFRSFIDANQKIKEDAFRKSYVAFVWKRKSLLIGAMAALKHTMKWTSGPVLRDLNPWSNKKKNSFTYLPVNERINTEDEILLPQVVHNFIDEAKHLIIMDKCGCRTAQNCQHHTHEVGCLFMGESTKDFPKGIHRKATREEAHAHVERAISAGLVPMAGKVRVDNDIFVIRDRQQLLSVCFCCHCCCMMTYFKHLPGSQLDEVMPRVEGLLVDVTDACVGCGTCISYCGFDAISLENGKAVHNDRCRACGRCERYCPQGAIRITNTNPHAVEDVKDRISRYVKVA